MATRTTRKLAVAATRAANKAKLNAEPVTPVESVEAGQPEDVNGVSKPERTVNGEPIPTKYLHLIPYAKTDQGLAEEAARLDEIDPERHERPKISVGPTATEKLLEGRLDGDDEGVAARDPLQALMDQHAEPGMAQKWLVNAETGANPGAFQSGEAADYVPVIDKHGRKVTISEMYLGKRPEERAIAHRRRVHKESQENLGRIESEQLEHAEKTRRDAKIESGHLHPVAAGDVLSDGSGGRGVGGFRQTVGNPEQLNR